jgi:hypothetical protein
MPSEQSRRLAGVVGVGEDDDAAEIVGELKRAKAGGRERRPCGEAG